MRGALANAITSKYSVLSGPQRTRIQAHRPQGSGRARPEVPWSPRVKGRTEREAAENMHGDHAPPCIFSAA